MQTTHRGGLTRPVPVETVIWEASRAFSRNRSSDESFQHSIRSVDLMGHFGSRPRERDTRSRPVPTKVLTSRLRRLAGHVFSIAHPEPGAFRARLGQIACRHAAVTAAGIALLFVTTATVAQDSRVTAVPVADMDAMSWLCVLDAGDSSPGASLRQSASAWAPNQTPAAFLGLDGRTGFRADVAANAAFASLSADHGVTVGVGLCHESFASGAEVLAPALSALDQGAILGAASTGADMLTSAGLNLAGNVLIPDPALRRAVEQELGKRADEPIGAVDLAGLTSLVARRAGIVNLSGLEFAVRLKHLDLYGNAVSDLSPLDSLTGLEMLSLAHNRIRDDAFSTLSRMTGLEVLSLAGNALDDLSPLAMLPRLRVLDLTSTAAGDLSPLSGLTQLEGLYLGDNDIEDATALAGLSRLRWLLLTDNAIGDLSPLSGLTGLRALSLAGNAVEDVSLLAGLTGLDTLFLQDNAIEDISPLAVLTGLELLHLSRNSVRDISPLVGLTELEKLFLGDNGIGDLSVLAGLTGLEVLALQGNAIGDLSVLAGLTGLRILYLFRNAIRDLSPLAGLTGLMSLYLSNNAVEDISPLVGLTELEFLDLWNNAIEDILPLVRNDGLADGDGVRLFGNPLSPVSRNEYIPDLRARGVVVQFDGDTNAQLSIPDDGLRSAIESELGKEDGDTITAADMAELTELAAESAGIEDLTGLEHAVNLTRLDLAFNDVRDLSPLAGLTGLTRLYLGNNAVEDIAALIENTGLDDGDFVSLTGNPLSDESIGVHIPALEARGVEVEFDAGVGFGVQRIITTDADLAYLVHAADLDGDGDPDVLSASANDDKIAWYENLGGGAFSAQRVITTDADGAAYVHAADLDGDGDPDVLSASFDDDKIAWYENLGGGTFSAQRVITTDADGAQSVHAADLDGDGDADVLSTSPTDYKIAWYENLGGGAFSAQRIIITDADRPSSVHAADLDGDGDPDVLSADWAGDKIAWYENLGGGAFSAQRIIATDADFAARVRAVDLDGDGDPDVLSASGNDDKIAWYENQGGGAFSAQRVITTSASVAGSVHAVDLDGDGDPDVLSASTGDDKIAWYENQGGGAFSAQRVITTNADGAESVYAADLDGDGDPDVLSASGLDDKIAWYENLSNHGDDHGDTLSAATLATALPAFLHGTVESGGDLDVFRVATGSGTLRVYSNGPTDMFGGLLDADGTILARDDDSGTGTNFQIQAQVEAGTHYVAVTGYDDETTGPYTLTLTLVIDEDSWPNFGRGLGNQTYTAGTNIPTLTLPAASDGNPPLTYRLVPEVPGLNFDPATRRLTGTPNTAGVYDMIFTVTDADGDTTQLVGWTITVRDPEHNFSYRESIGLGSLLYPRGITFADERLYIVSDTFRRVFVYGPDGRREEASDFDLDEDNGHVGGIVHFNGRIYVVDHEDDKVYAYRTDGQRDAPADFNLDGENANSRGITHANGRFYVVNDAAWKVFAYTESGQRESAADFDLDNANLRPDGIVYANDRFYVLDSNNNKAYAYRSDGTRDPAADFDLDSNTETAQGIAYGNGGLYVVGYRDDAAHVYSNPSGAGGNTSPAFATGSGPDDQTYFVGTAIDALTLPAASGGDGQLTYSLAPSVPGLNFDPATRRLTGTPSMDGRYEMTYTVADSDGDTDTLTFAITVELAGVRLAGSFDLAFGNSRSADITYANGRFYVVDWLASIFAYTDTGAPDTAANFSGLPCCSYAGITYDSDRFYVIVSGEGGNNSRVYAYGLDWQRDVAASFDLHDDNGNPHAIAHANGRLHVVDRNDARVYTYPLDRQRDAAPDIPHFDLAAGNDSPAGITYVNDRFYIADAEDNKVYAYLSDGRRDASAEFDLLVDNGTPNGIVYANGHFHVVQGGENKVYSYANPMVSVEERTVEAGFILDDENASAMGIAHANNRFFILDLTDEVFAYFDSGNRNAGSDFGLQFVGGPTGIVHANSRLHVVDTQADRVFAYRYNGQRETEGDFALETGNASPGGITYANGRFHVADYSGKVYAYGSGGQRAPAADFDLDVDNASPDGIAYAVGRFYVVDADDDKVYAYLPDGTRDTWAEFDLNASNGDASGIAFFNNQFYVVDRSDREVYTYAGPMGHFDLDEANGDPTGITYADDRFYVVDQFHDKVFAYGSDGQRAAAFDFDLRDGNDNPEGITYSDSRFYVVDQFHDKVFAYGSDGQRAAAFDFNLFSSEGNDIPRGITFSNAIVRSIHVVDRSAYMYNYRVDDRPITFNTYRLLPEELHSVLFGETSGVTYANDRLYVITWHNDRAYAYWRGLRNADADFDLGVGDEIAQATGITYADGRFFVVDAVRGKVHVLAGPLDPDLPERSSDASGAPAGIDSREGPVL